MYFTILYYVLNTMWSIASRSNHCTTTRKKFYTTNKLLPIAVDDRKIVPKKLLEMFFIKRTPSKKIIFVKNVGTNKP